ncbi:MAG: DUF1684 domain-containing protein [Bacteroidota bacterium]|nr:DUF1684 domain-containing protein [Bacteroidota bacterium]
MKSFKALEYFTVDTAYRIKAKLERTVNAETFGMKTTTERLPVYKTYGTAKFKIQAKEVDMLNKIKI